MKSYRIRSLRKKIADLEKQKPFKTGQKYLDLIQAIVDAKEKLNRLMYPKSSIL